MTAAVIGRRPTDGELWTPKPGGPYVIPEDWYHADRTALSSTGARTLTNGSPARFAWDREHGRKDKPHFDEGRAAHTQLLGVGAPLYVPRDEDGVPYERWQSNDAKAKVAAARARGETPVKADVAEKVAAMAAAIDEHETAGPLFARPGKAEQTFVARDPDNNVTCRIRCDWMPDVPAGQRLIIVDYKGTTCAEPKAFERKLAEYGYDQQSAFYIDILTWALGLEIPPAFIFVAQEKDEPYLVSVIEPKPYVIDGGRELNRHALATYARCTERDEWPGYDPGVHQADVPAWRASAYETAAISRFRACEQDLIGEPA